MRTCRRRKMALVTAAVAVFLLALHMYQVFMSDSHLDHTVEERKRRSQQQKDALAAPATTRGHHGKSAAKLTASQSTAESQTAKSGQNNSSHTAFAPYSEYRDAMIEHCPSFNEECIAFRKLLSEWPDGKPKAAFYILTQRSRIDYLKRVLQSIDKYFNDRFRYPVIIFHESNMNSLLPKVRTFCHSSVFFQEIKFELPTFLTKKVVFNIPCLSPIGYRHMCRFHAKLVYEQPILKGLEYYWRMDDDSILLREVNYDVFKYMRQHQLEYGYTWLHLDSTVCTEGLWDAAREFINISNTKTHFFNDWPQPRLYYNNFEIGKMSLWLSKSYADFIDYIDRKGGIFYHRWGDAPIKGIAVSMFMPRNHTHHFKDIGYQHGTYVNE